MIRRSALSTNAAEQRALIEHSIENGFLIEWERGEVHTSWADSDMVVIKQHT